MEGMETSRSFQEKMNEHVKDAENFSVKSNIIKHWMSSQREDRNRQPFGFSTARANIYPIASPV
jgi:hypothetical protein